MFVTAPKQNHSDAPQAKGSQPVSTDPSSFKPFTQLLLLQAVLEGLIDGVLLVTDQGEILKANRRAHEICSRLTQRQPVKADANGKTELASLPEEVWQACQVLNDSRSLFPGEKIIPELEVTLNDSTTVRIRVRWFDLENSDAETFSQNRLYILITLEDCNQTIEDRAIADMMKYGLTSRESDIWRLRLQGCSYRDIATRLYISENTVRKHIKNILAKRRLVLDTDTDPFRKDRSNP